MRRWNRANAIIPIIALLIALATPAYAQLPAPGNLTASVDSCWGVALAWDPQPAADSFAVFTADTVRYTTANEFRDSLATAGVNTTYHVAALNNAGVGDSATADGFRPAPFASVTGFAASIDRCDGINLTWSDVGGEAGYVVYRDGLLIDSLPPNAVAYLDGTAPEADSTAYRIESWSDCAPVPVASATLNGWRKPAAPPAVSGLAATSDLCTGIEVSWIDVPREQGYVIERDGVPIDTIGADLTVYLDASAFSDITYNYRVGPFNDCSLSPAYGSSITGRRLQPAPVAPTNVTASDTSCAAVFLSWNVSVTDGIYILYRDNVVIDTVPSGTLTYVDSVPGGSYVYGVAGENACGTSPDSTVAIGTVLPPVPAPPATVTASDTSCAVVALSWSSAAGADYYIVYRDGARVDSVGPAVLALVDVPGSSGSFSYGVASGNVCGISDSTEAKGEVLPGEPGALTGFTAGDTACVTVALGWDSAADADTVLLFRDGAPIAALVLGETTFDDPAGPGTYEYSAIAANECGRSIAVTDSVTVLAPPPSPTGLIASVDSCGLVRIDWTGAPNDTGYAVYRGGQFLANVAAPFYRDLSAPVGSNTYWVAARNVCGGSDSVSTGGTRPPDAPPAPAIVTATDDSCGVVVVDWSASADADSYFVYRDGAVIARTTLFTFTDSPAPGTYVYGVAAGNTCGVSDSTVNAGTVPLPAPVAPTITNATTTLCDRVDLVWSDVANEEGYVIFRDSLPIDTVAANTTAYSDSTIAAGASARYQAGAFNSCSLSPALSSELTGIRLPGPPPAVADLVATDDSCGVVVLTWTDVTFEDGYVIERDGVPVDTLAPGASDYRDSPGSTGVPIAYRVGVFNVCSNGVLYGNSDNGTAQPGAPETPTNLSASDDSCGATFITWTPAAAVDSQFVLRNGSIIARLGPVDASHRDSTALPLIVYTYGVRARNDCGSTESATDSGIRLPNPPGAPAGFTATIDSCAFVELAWSHVTGEEGMVLYRDGDMLAMLGPNVIVHRDSTATPGIAYTYQVGAYNTCSVTPALSDTATGARPAVPAPVTGLSASADDCEAVRLAWIAGSGETGYRVERNGALLIDLPPGTTAWDDSTIAAGTSATYRVGALADCLPVPAWSAEALGTRLPPVPGAPSNVAATDDSCGVVRVSWDQEPNADGYEVLRNGLFVGLVNDGSLFFRDLAPPPGAFYYEVRSLGACGVSFAAGDSGAAAEAPPVPVIDSASTGRCDGILISWADVTGEDGYIVYRNGLAIDTLPPNTLSYLDAVVADALPTLYRLGATSPCFPAPALSDPVQGERAPAPPVPVGDLSATSDRCDGVFLTWTDLARENGYVVARDGLPIDTLAAEAVSYLDTTAAPGAGYQYEVGGFNFCSGDVPVFGDAVAGARPFGTPPPVTNLTASQDSCGVIRLEWVAPIEGDTVSIVRDFVDEIARVPADAGFYRDSEPVTGSPTYSVVVENTCGASKPEVVQGARRPDTPAPPDTVFASQDSCDGVYLTWNDVANEFGYAIVRDGVYIDTVDADVTSYVDADAAPGIGTTYLIAPFNDCTVAPLASDPVIGMILPPPPVVTNLQTSTDNCAAIVMAWTPVPFAAGYSVERDGAFLDSLPPGAVVYVDTSAAHGSTHSYRVGAFNRCSGGPVFGTAVEGARPFDTPDPPAGVSATDDLCQVVNIVWSESENATSYVIERNGVFLGEVFAAPYFFTDVSVQPGTYTYAVKARNLCGTSAGSVDNGTRRAGPGEPGNLAATDDLCEGVRLTWTAAANAESYTIRRSGVTIATNLPPSTTTYFDDGATGGVPSIYTVEALNVCGSRISDPGVFGQRALGAPEPPTNVSATDNGCDDIMVTWSYTGSTTDLIGFQLSFRDLDAGGAYDSITTLPVSSSSFVHAPPPGRYEYWVSTVNQCGRSGQTAGSQNDGTRIGVPGVPAWSAASDSSSCTGQSFTLHWQPVDGATEYRITEGGTTVSTADTSFSFVRNQTGDFPFAVTAVNVCGAGQAGDTFTVMVLASPSPPTNVSATLDGCGFIDLSWQNGTDSRAWIEFEGDTTFLGAGIETWRDDHPDGGSRLYNVGSYNVCGTLASTTQLSGFAFPVSLPAPDSVDATDELCDSVVITWRYDSPLEPVESFRVIRYDGATATTIAVLASNAPFRVVDSPSDAASRRYGVQAENRCALSLATEDFGSANRTPGIPIWTSQVGSACEGESFSLRWQAATGAESYEVLRDGAVVATVVQPSLRLSLFELGDIEFRVRAMNACGAGPLGEAQIVRIADLPSAPLDVRIDSSFCDSVHVTWSPQLDSIVVTRTDRIDPVYVGAGNGFATDFPVKSATYRVRSFNGCGESEEVVVALARPLIKPPAPVALTATNTLCDSVVITWSMPQSQIVLDGFEITRTRNDSTTVVAPSLAASARRFVDRGGFGTYEYRIAARNDCGVSPGTEESTDIGSFRPAFVAPAFDTESDTVGCVGSDIELVWEPDPAALFYRVWKTGDNVPAAVIDGSNSTASIPASAVGDYSFELQVRTVCGDGPRSAPWLVRVGAIPARLTGLRASDDLCGAVRLDWNRSASVMESVRVYRDGVRIATAGPSDTSFVDGNAVLGETHEYYVVAASRCGAAGASNTASGFSLRGLTAPVLSGPPSGAANLPIPVTMSWTPVPGAAGYFLEVQDPDAGEIVIDTLLPAAPSATIGGLALGERYLWRVATVDDCGAGLPSAWRNFQTIQSAPTVLQSEPANFATGVALDADVHVFFSLPIDPATLGGARLFRDDIEVPVTRRLETEGSELVVDPVDSLRFNTTYSLLLGGLEDVFGQGLGGTAPITFTTAPAPRPFGDIDSDFQRTPADVVRATDIVLGRVDPSTYDEGAIDLNADGRFGVGDLVFLTKLLVNEGVILLPDFAKTAPHTVTVEAIPADANGTCDACGAGDESETGVARNSDDAYTLRFAFENGAPPRGAFVSFDWPADAGRVIGAHAGDAPVIFSQRGGALTLAWTAETGGDAWHVRVAGGRLPDALRVAELILALEDGSVARAKSAGGSLGVDGPRLSRVIGPEASPNPFNPTTTLRYHLPGAADVRLTIYDLAGRAVRTLEAGPRAAGWHAPVWDGTSDAGEPVASGLYFVRFETRDGADGADGAARTSRIVLIR